MRIDLHTHSRVSDGTDTPTGLVMKAAEAGLDVIALTDHDTFDGVAEAQEAGRRLGIRVVAGIEISTELNGRSVHLLGYGCDTHDHDLLAELTRVRVGRTERLPQMCARLEAAGVGVTMDEVLAAAKGAPSIGRPHFADAMVAKGYVKDRDEAFRRYLAEDRPGYVGRYATEVGRAVDLVHGARGVAVLAHPWGRGNARVATAEVIESLVREHGLDGIEVLHPDHDQHTRELLSELGARLGLVRTGSSDYHGSGKKDNPLAANLTRESAFNELVRRMGARRSAGR